MIPAAAPTIPVGAPTPAMQWCPHCKMSVKAVKSVVTGKFRCIICGSYTTAAALDPDIVVNVPKKDNTICIVYCTKCGNHYSSGECDEGHDASHLRKGL